MFGKLAQLAKTAISGAAKKYGSKEFGQMAKDQIVKTMKTIAKSMLVHLFWPILIVIFIIALISAPVLDTKAGEGEFTLAADGNYIVKTDEPGAAPVVNESQLKKGIETWLPSQQGMRDNALKVLSTVIENQDTYKVNAVFVMAFLRNETGIGTADTTYVKQNNWSSWLRGHVFASPEENVTMTMKNIATGSYYFTQGKITVHDIGDTYCPNEPEHPNQNEGWKKAISQYMTDLYAAMGITAESDNSLIKGSDFLQTAQKCINYLRANKYRYSAAKTKYVPLSKEVSKLADCSSYVSWVLYESGLTQFGGMQKNSGYFYNNSPNWPVVRSQGDLKPGDILAYDGHVEIYAGNGTIYNCGSNSAINKNQPYPQWKSFSRAVRPPVK